MSGKEILFLALKVAAVAAATKEAIAQASRHFSSTFFFRHSLAGLGCVCVCDVLVNMFSVRMAMFDGGFVWLQHTSSKS